MRGPASRWLMAAAAGLTLAAFAAESVGWNTLPGAALVAVGLLAVAAGAWRWRQARRDARWDLKALRWEPDAATPEELYPKDDVAPDADVVYCPYCDTAFAAALHSCPGCGRRYAP